MNILKMILASALITSLTLFSACSEEKIVLNSILV